MDLLLQGLFSTTGITVLRIAAVFAFVLLLYFLLKPFRTYHKAIAKTGPGAVVPEFKYPHRTGKVFAAFVGLVLSVGVYLTTYTYGAFLPKVTVVEETSTEQAEREVKEAEALVEQVIPPAAADAAKEARKSNIDIREEFAKHPDKE